MRGVGGGRSVVKCMQMIVIQFARSGDTERSWTAGAQIHAGRTRHGHDKRRLDISGCRDISGKSLALCVLVGGLACAALNFC